MMVFFCGFLGGSIFPLAEKGNEVLKDHVRHKCF